LLHLQVFVWMLCQIFAFADWLYGTCSMSGCWTVLGSHCFEARNMLQFCMCSSSSPALARTLCWPDGQLLGIDRDAVELYCTHPPMCGVATATVHISIVAVVHCCTCVDDVHLTRSQAASQRSGRPKSARAVAFSQLSCCMLGQSPRTVASRHVKAWLARFLAAPDAAALPGIQTSQLPVR
jgi:hypothetical protein